MEWVVTHQWIANTLLFWLKSVWFYFMSFATETALQPFWLVHLCNTLNLTRSVPFSELLPTCATGPAASIYIFTCQMCTRELTRWSPFLPHVCIMYLKCSATVPKEVAFSSSCKCRETIHQLVFTGHLCDLTLDIPPPHWRKFSPRWLLEVVVPFYRLSHMTSGVSGLSLKCLEDVKHQWFESKERIRDSEIAQSLQLDICRFQVWLWYLLAEGLVQSLNHLNLANL